jgi:hypothetical protein
MLRRGPKRHEVARSSCASGRADISKATGAVPVDSGAFVGTQVARRDSETTEGRGEASRRRPELPDEVSAPSRAAVGVDASLSIPAGPIVPRPWTGWNENGSQRARMCSHGAGRATPAD